MGYHLLEFTKPIQLEEQLAYGDHPGFLDHLRDTAAHALARTVMRDASIYSVKYPDKDKPWAPVIHSWKVGVEASKDELRTRELDMESARRLGHAEAGKRLRERAATLRASQYKFVNELIADELELQAALVEIV